MPSYRGAKRSGNHSTLIDDAVQVVRYLQGLPHVTKISPGFIKVSGKRTRMTLKCTEQAGCLLVKVHGMSAVQELRVYGVDLREVHVSLSRMFA